MKILFIMSFFSHLTFASTLSCPSLKGKYFCKGVAGSHKDMTMEITEEMSDEVVKYTYLYLQADTAPLRLSFLASDEGIENPNPKMIGRCFQGNFYNSKNGEMDDKTLFNKLDEKGDYVVIRKLDNSVFLHCPKI